MKEVGSNSRILIRLKLLYMNSLGLSRIAPIVSNAAKRRSSLGPGRRPFHPRTTDNILDIGLQSHEYANTPRSISNG